MSIFARRKIRKIKINVIFEERLRKLYLKKIRSKFLDYIRFFSI